MGRKKLESASVALTEGALKKLSTALNIPSEQILEVLNLKKSDLEHFFVGDAKQIRKLLRDTEVIENIKKQVKEKIETWDVVEMTRWEEGVIYKIKINIFWMEQYFIATKDRFDGNVDHESEMLEQANDIVLSHDPSTRARVPDFFWEISVNGTPYLVMEFIDWKTVEGLQLEVLAKYIVDKLSTLENMPILENYYNENSEFVFDFDDIDARSRVIALLDIAQMNGLFSNTSLNVLLESFPFNFFTVQEAKEINAKIKKTLDIFHENHFYHRDLWGNPRNLMIKKVVGKDGKYVWIPYIIDFGKSITADVDYNAEFDNGVGPYVGRGKWYFSDSNICSYISRMAEKEDIVKDDSEKLLNLWTTQEKYTTYTKSFLAKYWLTPDDITQLDIEDFFDFLSDYALECRTNNKDINNKEILKRFFSLSREDISVLKRKIREGFDYDSPFFKDKYDKLFTTVFPKLP